MFRIFARPSSVDMPMDESVDPSNVNAAGSNPAAGAGIHASASVHQAAPFALTAPPELPNVLWGEIAEFMPRDDILMLRSVRKNMAGWVDRSIRNLQVTANNMPAMLPVVSRSTSLKHIDALRVTFCTNTNLPAAMMALSALPHAKLHLTLARTPINGQLLDDELGMQCLRWIEPATLCIEDHGRLTLAQVRLLAGLPYPVSLKLGCYRVADVAALRALATIPTLFALDMEVEGNCNEMARAFRQHDRLRDLHITPRFALSLSDEALADLAAIPTLQTLQISGMRGPLGKKALSALADNRGLISLIVDVSHRPLDAAAALMLSANTSLKTLSLSLCDGWSSLARMRSLRDLTLYGATRITLSESRSFSQHARLQKLNISNAQFEEGALMAMVSAAIEHLEISALWLNRAEIDALLENRTLRSLDCAINGAFADAVASAIALASHPTLESLTLRHDRDYSLVDDGVARRDQPGFYSMMTVVEREAMLAAWGPHRPISALRVRFLTV